MALALALLGGAVACGGPDDEDDRATTDTTVPDTAGDLREGCLLSPYQVGRAIDAPASATGPMAGGSSGDVDDDEYGLSWKGCAYEASDGSSVTVAELVDGEGQPDVAGFDQLAAMAEHPDPADDASPGGDGDVSGDAHAAGGTRRGGEAGSAGGTGGTGRGRHDVPVRLDGVGEDAVLHEDRIYVLGAGRAAMAEGETAGGVPLGHEALEALGLALADELG